MASLRGVPPGRAGQVWLRHRLAVAERGADLLDQKLRILHAETARLQRLTDRTGATWAAAHREAQTWLVRAALLAGDRGLRLAAPAAEPDVRIGWTHTMGATYPVTAEVTVPSPSPQDLPAASAALVAAREAYRRATTAAVEHAATQAALRVVTAEEAATRHRLRALTTHWIPRLTSALAATRLALEEQEHQDAVRLRWVRATAGGTRPGGQEGAPA